MGAIMASRFCLAICALVVLSSAITRGEEAASEKRSLVDQMFASAPNASQNPHVTPAAIVYVRISRDYLAPRFERDVDRKKPLTDEVLGTSIRGTSHTRGQTHLTLLPSTDSVRAQIEFTGTCSAKSRGYNGPAVLQLESDSTFRATKLLVLNDSGFSTKPAIAKADTRQRATDVRTRRDGPFSPFVERVARRRIAETQAEADAIASQHTADRVAKDLDTRLDAAVDTFADRLLTAAGVQVSEIKSFTTSDGQPLRIRLRSTPTHVELAMSSSDAAWTEFEKQLPTIAGNPHVAVRIHRTFVTHVAANSHKSPTIARLLSTGLQTHLTRQTAAILESDAVPTTNEPTWSIGLDWVSLDLHASQPDTIAYSR